MATTTRTLVIDNGGGAMKIAFVEREIPYLFGNFVAKSRSEKKEFTGDVSQSLDKAGLVFHRPHDRGYLVDWELEKEIWTVSFAHAVNPSETTLLVTQPFFVPSRLERMQAEVVFEDFKFHSMYACNAATLASIQAAADLGSNSPPGCLVLDCGHSFTHAVPFMSSYPVTSAVRRLNLGGKALTNYLKELVSFRQWNMMQETHLMSIVKEKMCFVSLDYDADVRMSAVRGPANRIAAEYVLPDYVTSQTGYIRGVEAPPSAGEAAVDEQILRMGNERFAVPEILFRPADIGVLQGGVSELILEAVRASPPELQPTLLANVVLIGGTVQLPGFQQRVQNELRAAVPAHLDVRVRLPDYPVAYAWRGGRTLAAHPDFAKLALRKATYDEMGYDCLRQRFLR